MERRWPSAILAHLAEGQAGLREQLRPLGSSRLSAFGFAESGPVLIRPSLDQGDRRSKEAL